MNIRGFGQFRHEVAGGRYSLTPLPVGLAVRPWSMN
jgi:hypothetical protein